MLSLALPWMLVLLPLPWLLRRLLPAYREARPAVRAPFTGLLARLAEREPSAGAVISRRARIQWWVLSLAWIALVLALSKPQWLDDPIVRDLPMRDLLVALDLSGSMETRDFRDRAGSTADRLVAAKEVLDDFLARREGDRIGLILFGSAAFVQVPFTDDLDVVRQLLDEAQVRMLGPRTMLGDAIGLAISLFERSEVEERVLIVLTDGNDTGSMVPPERAAEIARDEGVTVHAVAMGDPSAAGEAALDEATLTAIAEATGGGYFHAADRAELEFIYRRLDELNPRLVETQSFRPRLDLFHWPLGAGLLIGLLLLAGTQLASLVSSRQANRPVKS